MSLIRNASLNVLGLLSPMVVAVLAVPVMLHHIGPERFGVVSIAWVLIGYFGVLDFGLGRALTQAVAANGDAAPGTQLAIAEHATRIMLGLGGLWGAVLAILTPVLVSRWLSVPADWAEDAGRGFYWLAAAVPALMYSNARLAEIEGLQRFGTLTAIRVPLGALLVLVPMLVSMQTESLEWILGSIAAVRVLAAVLMRWRLRGAERGDVRTLSTEQVRALFRMGGWLTVSNIVSPLMTYCDRFYIAAVLGTAAVAFYVVPYDVLVRLTVFPFAALGVLFPLISSLPQGGHGVFAPQLRRAWHALFLLWWPGVALTLLLGREILRVWVGPDYVRESLLVWQVLSVGVFANGLAFLPFNLIQGMGRTDLTAKLHLVEFPVYLLALYFALSQWGLLGVAVAWTLRVSVDCIGLFVIAARLNDGLRPVLMRALGMQVLGSACLCALMFTPWTSLRYAAAFAMAAILVASVWNIGSTVLRRMLNG